MSPVKIQVLDNLFIYSLTALISSLLLCFSPFLHPLFACIKVLLVLPNPQITSLFFSSKFLFVVGNFIFIFLIGDSKIYTSFTTSTCDFYYKSLANLSLLDKKEDNKLEKFFEEKIISCCEGGEGKLEEWIEERKDAKEELNGEGKLEEWIEEKQDVEEGLDREGKLEEWIEEKQEEEEEEELDGEGKFEEWTEEKQDVEELNKRVDEFIARVQKRRSLELFTCF